MITASIVPLFVAIPLAGAFLIALLKRIKGMPDILGVLASAGTGALSIMFLLNMEIGQRIIYNIGNWGGFNEVLGKIVSIQLVMDGLTIFMLLIVNLSHSLWLCTRSIT